MSFSGWASYPGGLPETALCAQPGPAARCAGIQIDLDVPVRDEERDLARSIRRLDAYLHDQFPFSARITIADNGSTDRT